MGALDAAVGRTMGFITSTCISQNINLPGLTLLCQHTADYYMAEGDSGAPIFQVLNEYDDVELNGINVGFFGAESVFSDIQLVMSSQELGSLNVTAVSGGSR